MHKPTKADSPHKTCTLDGCERALRARGLCSSHYNAAHHPNRHAKKMTPCTWCGTEVLKGSGGGRKYGAVCSDQCRAWLSYPFCILPADHWARWYGKSSTWPRKSSVMTEAGRRRHNEWAERSRSPLAVAVRDGEHAEVVRLIKQDVLVTETGCWEWQRRLKDGYPQIRLAFNGKHVNAQVHRLSLEAKHGKPLGRQAAHHICANTRCVNPEHLQPVTHRENMAEMMQRNYFITRIHELEAALMNAAPDHPLLIEIGIPTAA